MKQRAAPAASGQVVHLLRQVLAVLESCLGHPRPSQSLHWFSCGGGLRGHPLKVSAIFQHNQIWLVRSEEVFHVGIIEC